MVQSNTSSARVFVHVQRLFSKSQDADEAIMKLGYWCKNLDNGSNVNKNHRN